MHDDNVLIMGMFCLLLSGAYTEPRLFLLLTHPSSKGAGDSTRTWEGTQSGPNDQSDIPYPEYFALQEQLQEDEGMKCLMELCFPGDGLHIRSVNKLFALFCFYLSYQTAFT